MKAIIDTAHKQAKEIIQHKRDVLEKVKDILLEKETIYKEEFEMLYNGATVEEVKLAIDQKEAEKKAVQEKAKKEAIEEHKTRDIKQRVETAEALAKAGVITKQDLENIKKEAEKEYNEFVTSQKATVQSEEVKVPSEKKPNDETGKKD